MKKLQKGFTLVELIVVMALMGIIMAIVFSVIGPTTRVFAKVDALKDSEDTGIQITKYLKNTLTFATNVSVSAANDGEAVPAPPASMNSTLPYVYVIDNTKVRDSSAKGAKGYIYIGKWNGTTITDLEPLAQEAEYYQNEYVFSVDEYNGTRGTGDSPGNAYIMITVKGYPMHYDGTGYSRDEDKVYTYKECIEFMNINNWYTLQKGGNTDAPGYKINIDAENLATKTDKIYIFFNPASETAIATGRGIYDPAGGGPDPTDPGSGGSSSGGSGGTTTTTYNVTYHYSKKPQTKTVTVTSGNYAQKIADIKADEYAVDDDTCYYVFKGWYTHEDGTGTVIANNNSVAVTSDMSFYACYTKMDRVVASYYQEDGTTLIGKERLDKGSEAKADGITAPTPPSSGTTIKVFDKWVPLTSSDPEFGTALNANASYKATYKEVNDATTINLHFADKYTGKVKFTYSGFYSVNGGPTVGGQNIYNHTSNETTYEAGETRTLVVTGGSGTFTEDYITTYVNSERTVTLSCPVDKGTHDYYFYYDPSTGEPKIASAAGNRSTKINVVFVDEGAFNKVTVRPNNGNALIDVPGGASYTYIAGGSGQTLFEGDCKDTKQITIRTPVKLYPNETWDNAFSIANDGVEKTVYAYKEGSDLKFSYTKPERITKVTVYYVDDSTSLGVQFYENNSKIRLEQNASPAIYPGNGYRAVFFGNHCHSGDKNVFYIWQKVFIAEGTTGTEGIDINNTKPSVTVWFVDGKFTTTKPEGWVDPNGVEVPDGAHLITLNITSAPSGNNLIQYLNDGGEADFEIKGDLTVTRTKGWSGNVLDNKLKDGQTLYIIYYSQNFKFNVAYTGDVTVKNTDAEFTFDGSKLEQNS